MKSNDVICRRTGLQFHVAKRAMTVSAMAVKVLVLTMTLEAERARRPETVGFTCLNLGASLSIHSGTG
jgi:hypothetical protein